MLQSLLVQSLNVGCIGLSHRNDTISKPWQHPLILAKHFRWRKRTDKPDSLKLLESQIFIAGWLDVRLRALVGYQVTVADGAIHQIARPLRECASG